MGEVVTGPLTHLKLKDNNDRDEETTVLGQFILESIFNIHVPLVADISLDVCMVQKLELF